jgi:ribose 1,5-bisphosphate isomerase
MSIVSDIKSLKIQGATNVAITSLKELQLTAEKSSDKQLMKNLKKKANILLSTRPTEPMMRNALKYVIHFVEIAENKRKVLKATSDTFVSMVKKSKENIGHIGAKRIKHFDKVLTHCHSSTVMRVLKEARPGVICTESRPRYQGRLSALELAENKVKVKMIVDSAVNNYMHRVDCVVVGADLITSEGNAINKIGTSQIALCAEEHGVPFFVATSLLKFDPETIFGTFDEIEQRNPDEIWKKKHKNIEILNPAFGVTPHKRIESYITEFGVYAPESLYEIVQEHYRWIFGGVR